MGKDGQIVVAKGEFAEDPKHWAKISRVDRKFSKQEGRKAVPTRETTMPQVYRQGKVYARLT